MQSIDGKALVAGMLGAAKTSLGESWPAAKDYAESEFRKIAESIAFIEKQRLLGAMSEEHARLHLQMQRNTARMVLLSLQGLGLLAVEEALNAALKVVKDTVNTALGFVLI